MRMAMIWLLIRGTCFGWILLTQMKLRGFTQRTQWRAQWRVVKLEERKMDPPIGKGPLVMISMKRFRLKAKIQKILWVLPHITAKKGRNISLCTIKGATSKQQAGGSRLKKVDSSSGTKSGNASLCTTKSATSKKRSFSFGKKLK